MSAVFVDTLYFVARINKRDQWHEAALALDSVLEDATLVTTESVIIELLNFFAGYPATIKQSAAALTRDLWSSDIVEIIPHNSETLLDALALYEARLDKGFSLTDCISMVVMRRRSIGEVLTHDHHFTQEGFNILLH